MGSTENENREYYLSRYAKDADGNEYYAKDSNGNDIILLDEDGSKKLISEVENGKPIMPKKNDGTCIFEKDEHGNDKYPVVDRDGYYPWDKSNTKQCYAFTKDGEPKFLENSAGTSYYAMNEEGDEIYPTIEGKEIYMRVGDVDVPAVDKAGKPYYAKNAGSEYYPKIIHDKNTTKVNIGRLGYVFWKEDCVSVLRKKEVEHDEEEAAENTYTVED